MKINKRILTMIIGTLIIGSIAVGCDNKTDNAQEVQIKVEDKKEPAKEEVEEVNEVIYDKDGIKVTYQGIDIDESYASVTNMKFKVENNSGKNITVQTENVSINNIMSDAFISETLPTGKMANGVLSLWGEDLKRDGIDKIEKFETELLIMDNDNAVNLDKKNITLEFSDK